MVRSPLVHAGEIYTASNGDNSVAFNNSFDNIDIRMGIIYTCMGTKYIL